MELPVNNKIISFDLSVKEVYKKIWIGEAGNQEVSDDRTICHFLSLLLNPIQRRLSMFLHSFIQRAFPSRFFRHVLV